MEERVIVKTGGGIGFTGMLAIAFIVLKLLGVIDWSWWWVLAPIWIPVAIGIIGALIILIFYLVAIFFIDS